MKKKSLNLTICEIKSSKNANSMKSQNKSYRKCVQFIYFFVQLEKGANPHYVDDDGKKPIDYIPEGLYKLYSV